MRRKAWGSLITVLAITVLLSLFAVFSVSAATASGTFGEDGASVRWSFDSASGTLTISGKGEMADASLQSVAPWYDYHSAIRHVVVSSGVTSIGNYAFRDCSALTSVSIATSVAEIGEYAFTRCTSLSAISIPSGVKTLGAGAFSFCSSLASVSISKGLQSIGAAAFIYCESIETIAVDGGNSTYYSSGNCLIEKDSRTLVLGCKNSVIPSSVLHIGDYAFHYCLGLTSIGLPSGLKSVGVSAFQYCKSLKSIDFPDVTAEIGAWAFAGCSSLKSADLPSALTKIEQYLFYYCPSLSSVQLPRNIIAIGDSAFYFCSSLKTVTLPSRLTSLGANAFNACPLLEEVIFLSKNVVISSSAINKSASLFGYAGSTAETFATKNGRPFEAFAGETTADGLSWSISPNGDLVISGSGAMANYEAGTAPWYLSRADIVSVTVEKGVTGIGSYAFYGCSAMTDIWLSSTVTSIGSHTFAGCSSLESIELPKNLATVGADVFDGCTSLSEVYFLSANTAIAQSADTVYQGAKLYGYAESTAKEYAAAYGRDFALLPSIHGVGADGLSWELTADGELVISGEGDMADYPNDAPWMPSKGGVETFDAIDEEKLTAAGLNSSGALFGFYSSIGGTDSFSVISDENGKYIQKEADTAATINLLDSFDFINNEKFIIAFDYRMEGSPNSGGILSLNNRALGETDEMRILSTKSGQGGVFFGQNGMAVVSGIDYNSPTWISFCVVVDPITYNYEIYVDGKLTLYTVTDANAKGGHYVYYLENGEWTKGTVTGNQSPFTNVDGMIKSVYMFHYSGTKCSIDNLCIRPLSDITKVTLKNGVTSIGANAFRYCTKLTSVTIPMSVLSIGDSAFYATDVERIDVLLKDVAIYDSEKTLPLNAVLYGPEGSTLETYAEKYDRQFVGVTVTLAEGKCGNGLIWKLNSDGVLAIDGSGNMSDYIVGDAPWYEYLWFIRSVAIGEGVTSVGDNAFRGCSKITSVTLSSSVRSIGEYAFSDAQFESILLPAGLQSIEQGTFLNCTALKTVSIPNTIMSIEAKTFSGCTSLASISLSSPLTEIKAQSFADCKALAEITIPKTVENVGEAAFRGCTDLTKITFVGKNTAIYNGANTIPETATIYGYGGSTAVAYADRYSRDFVMINAVASGTFGEGLAWTVADDGSLTILGKGSIPNYYSPNMAPWVADYGDSITSVSLGEGITAIGAYAFQKHPSLESVSLPSTLTNIYAGGFAYCTGLTRVDIPESVEKIGAYAFNGCTSLADIYIYSTGTVLNSSANVLPKATVIHCATNASAMTYAQKYNRVTEELLVSVGGGMCGDGVTWELFMGGLLVISGDGNMNNYSQASPAPWNSQSAEAIRTIRIEDGVTSVGSYAFHNLPLLTNVSLSDSVVSIGVSGFAICRGLKEIRIPSAVKNVGSYAFYACHSLEDIYFDSLKTVVFKSENTLPANATIHCAYGSAVHDYAKKFNRPADVSVVVEHEGAFGDGLMWTMWSDGRLVISGEGAIPNYNSSNRAPWYSSFFPRIKEVVIEEGVTAIGAYAFQNHKALESVTIPGTVKTIGVSGFALCQNLTEVEIPESVKSVNSYAFYGCSAMTDIYFLSGSTALANGESTLPANATIHCAYGSAAHAYAKKFNRPADVAVVVEREGTFGENLNWRMWSDGRLVISGEGAIPNYNSSNRAPWYSSFFPRIKEVVIEEGVTAIGAYAFQNHKALESVTIPSTVKTIGVSAFALCNSLREIEIPETVTAIHMYAFYMAGLKEITVLSADISITTSKTTIPEETLIRGVGGSGAEAYADRFNRVFIAISDVVKQGSCGTELKWNLHEGGELLVFGDGEMGNYTSTEAPWNSQVLVREDVDGLTSAADMFSDLGDLFTFSYASGKLPTIGTEGDNKYLSVTTASALFLSDDTDFLDKNPFEISFDLKIGETSGGNGILSLNKRTGGAANEMRIISEYDGELTFSGDTGRIPLVSIKNRTGWTPVKVVVYPATYDYMVFIDNALVLYTATKSEGGHIIYVRDESGAFVDSGVTMSQSLSPFENLSGQIDGIYFFHYVNKGKMIDNITVRTVSEVDSVVVANGVENIGANAFSDLSQVTSATVAATVAEIGEGAFASTALSEIRILSADVVIFDSADTIPATATIYGYSGSTAASYAEKYGRTFVAIN